LDIKHMFIKKLRLRNEDLSGSTATSADFNSAVDELWDALDLDQPRDAIDQPGKDSFTYDVYLRIVWECAKKQLEQYPTLT